ncbi:helix-turn-helix domain-containing protein [Myroides odoratus]|uniref:helix-turn-helix domain-containing protein n=1 Tax=Myroides odoratus TaxID=256 RepID=UPI0039B0421D
MEHFEKIDTVKNYNDYTGVDTLHPLVSVVNFSELRDVPNFKRYMGIYAIFLKDTNCGDIRYGNQPYDYEDGTLVFVSPGQIYGIDNHSVVKSPKGYGLVFHPDLLVGTNLGKTIKAYSFFSYEVNEALHLSKKEHQTIVSCFEQIAVEINQNIDTHSKTLLVSNIELLLNYCMRFYDRQFITRNHINTDILTRFESLLHAYFQSNNAQDLGLPSVTWCAEQLHLSPNYLGDLIKKETGHTALDLIQSRLIEEAKLRIFDANTSISDLAFQLGFKYQQHFSRLFKQKTGMTPNEFRHLN